MYFMVDLVTYDHNNVPNSVGEFVIKADSEPDKTEVKEFFEDNTDVIFESVFSIEEISEDEAFDYAEPEDIYEL